MWLVEETEVNKTSGTEGGRVFFLVSVSEAEEVFSLCPDSASGHGNPPATRSVHMSFTMSELKGNLHC